MEKVRKCIQMLQLLNSGRLYKVSELAEELGMSVRNVVEYRKTLGECGYDIISVPGRYGGYQLNRNVVIPALKLLPEEKDALMASNDYLRAKKDFPKKAAFLSALGKISSSLELPSPGPGTVSFDHFQLAMGEEEIAKRHAFIEQAIEKRRVIEIRYASIKSGPKTHVLHPYTLFLHNNSWFFLALNPEAQAVWYFKLNRILDMKMLDKRFTVIPGYRPEQYFDEQGFKVDGGYYHVELLAKGTRRLLLKERVYGRSQEAVDVDGETIKVTLDMPEDDQTVAMILSWGEEVTVLGPKDLRKRIKEKLTLMLDKLSDVE